jgi:ATP-dependent Lon protease
MSESHQTENVDFEKALSAIPIFPLPQVVLFPEAILPLHVFEPRYRAMVQHCLATHGAMVVAQVIPGEDEHGRPRISPVAGGGIVIEHQPLADGRANIVLRGRARLRLDELDPDDSRPFRMARATVLEDMPVSVRQNDRTALVAAATMFASEVKKHDPSFTFKLPPSLDASRFADLCAFQLVVDAGVRQAILDELDPRVRVEIVLGQLALQHGAMINTDKNRVLVLN